LAENGDFSEIPADVKKRGKYNIAQREWAKREIRKLLIDGYTNDEISAELKIPKRTLERYLHDIFEEDNYILTNPTAEQVETSVNIFRARLAAHQREVLEIARDKEQNGQIRLSAYELATDFAWAYLGLGLRPPDWIARHLTLKSNKLVQEQKGLDIRLRLVKHPRSQLPSHYDVIDNNGKGIGENNNNNHTNDSRTTSDENRLEV
jgi:hypothetical protein